MKPLPLFPCVLAVIALATLVVSVSVAIEQGEVFDLPEASLSGIASDSGGRIFAILKDVGIVRAGDTIPHTTTNATCTLQIVSISQNTVRVKAVRVIAHAPKPKPAKPEDPVFPYDTRDPFWPVGFDPRPPAE